MAWVTGVRWLRRKVRYEAVNEDDVEIVDDQETVLQMVNPAGHWVDVPIVDEEEVQQGSQKQS